METDLRLKLQAPLDRSFTRTRSQGNMNLTYVEGWYVISKANEIFGFDGWNRTISEPHLVQCEQRQDKKWVVGYTAQCTIQVGGCLRMGVGFGQGIDNDQGRAHESAIKEAETDSFKRAMVTFGNQFGLELYDKDALTRAGASGTSTPPPEAPHKPTSGQPNGKR